jgi:hypothetical protein
MQRSRICHQKLKKRLATADRPSPGVAQPPVMAPDVALMLLRMPV